MLLLRKSLLTTVRRVGETRITVWATGFSVAQTEKSVAQSVAAPCAFHAAPCLFASILKVENVKYFYQKLHVVGRVCNVRPYASKPRLAGAGEIPPR